MRLHPLALALLLTGFSAQSQATDLLQAYDLARQSDPQLSAAESQKSAQGEGVVQSRAALLPQINGSMGVTRSKSDGTLGNGSTFDSSGSNRDTSIQLTQSIYDHGDYKRLSASKARALQSAADFDAAEDALTIRLADAYFNVLTGIETLASARAEERSVKRQLDQADKRLEVGLAPITDVHEARARYDSSRANTITQSNALDDAYEALAEITGQPLTGLRGLSTDYRPDNSDTRTIEDWVKIAIDSNPTLKSRELAVEAADQDVRAARAAHYPTLGASVNWGDSALLSGDSGPFSTTQSSRTSLGLQLTVPIFSGFATQSGVRQAIYRRDIATDQLEQQKRAITRLTRSAFRSLAAGQAEVEARRLAVVSAQAAYEAGEAGLEVGTRTIVDVLIAQQSLYLAQREYARVRHAFLVNTLRLRQAAGILELSDVQNVNRSLTVDAEAALINN